MSAVITGASRGIGLELCRQLGHKDASSYPTIYALCRKPSPELTALAQDNPKVSIVPNINVTSATVGSDLSQALQGVTIQLLIHNAGAYGPNEDFASASEMYASQTLENVTLERLNYAMQLNAFSPLMIT